MRNDFMRRGRENLRHRFAGCLFLSFLIAAASISFAYAEDYSCGPNAVEIGRVDHGNSVEVKCRCAKGFQVKGGACVPAAVSAPHATINPGALITEAEYKSARKRLEHLQALQKRLEKKLAEVRDWGAGLGRDEREFQTMRAEAEQDLSWQFIDHAPVLEGLDELKGSAALKGVDIEKIEIAYETAKGLAETTRGISAKEGKEKAERIETGNRELRNAMMGLARLNEKDKALLTAVSRIMDYGAKAALAAGTSGMSDRDKLKTIMSLVEALEPWWGLAVLGENLAERGGQYWEAGKALDSLHEAQSSNWNAERYLRAKLDRVKADSENVRLTMTKYEMAHGR